MSFCDDCQGRLDLGDPSVARWSGPDGGKYCSMHFISRFGHGERLVKLEDFEPPQEIKKPAPKKPKKKTAPKEVEA